VSPDYEDPGWGRALMDAKWWVFAVVGLARARRTKPRVAQLIELRASSVGIAAADVVFLLSLVSLAPLPEGWHGSFALIHRAVAPYVGIAAIAIFDAAVGFSVRKRMIGAMTAGGDLMKIYRGGILTEIGLAESIALWGFVFVFISGSLGPYLVALPLTLIALFLVAPSKRNIMRLQRRLADAAGKPIELGRALTAGEAGPDGIE
jgi:hypothetical protein